MEPVAAEPRCRLKGVVLAQMERASLAGPHALGRADSDLVQLSRAPSTQDDI